MLHLRQDQYNCLFGNLNNTISLLMTLSMIHKQMDHQNLTLPPHGGILQVTIINLSHIHI